MDRSLITFINLLIFSFLIVWTFLVAPREASRIIIPAVLLVGSLGYLIKTFKNPKVTFEEIEENFRYIFKPKKGKSWLENLLFQKRIRTKYSDSIANVWVLMFLMIAAAFYIIYFVI